jgi:hypothetical protein
MRRIHRGTGIEPAPERDRQTWAAFLRGQAHAILACDFFTVTTLNGATLYVFAVIEHASRRIRILGVTVHPTADWVTQGARNVDMDIQDADATVTYLIRDRDSKFTRAVEDLPAQVRHRAHLSADQSSAGLDPSAGPHLRAGRALDVADPGSTRPTPPFPLPHA